MRATWSSPRVVNDSPFDDRDAGVISPGGKQLVITWFTSDTRHYVERSRDHHWLQEVQAGLIWMTDENAPRFVGSWVRCSDDGGDTWGAPIRVPLTAPHGAIRLRSGSLFYLGKEFGRSMKEFTSGTRNVCAMVSRDCGRTWEMLGTVPLYPGTRDTNYHEPHVVELPSGKLIGHIRFQYSGEDAPKEAGLVSFSIFQTESTDGGRTWTQAKPLGFHGSPPHLLLHSSGALVCTYGYRQEPYGERAAISYDEGNTWQHVVLRDDGPDGDLGYPSSVELSDGSIFTVYYQKPLSRLDRCALLWTRWQLERNGR